MPVIETVRSRRSRDVHHDGVPAYDLDALADVASQRGLETATHWIDQLEQLSIPHGMRALSSNAANYRKR